jgi:hypothetical protein
MLTARSTAVRTSHGQSLACNSATVASALADLANQSMEQREYMEEKCESMALQDVPPTLKSSYLNVLELHRKLLFYTLAFSIKYYAA